MLKPETYDMGKYLQLTDIIDYDQELIKTVSEKLRLSVL